MIGFATPAGNAPAVLPDALVTPQGIVTFRAASTVYASNPTDAPANTVWPARLLGDVALSQSAVDAVGVGGRVALGLADIDLWDGDGALASLVRYGTADGRRVTVRVATAANARASDVSCPLSAAGIAWAGIVRAVDSTEGLQARLSVVDISQRLATPLQPSRYLGTGGMEGPATLKDAPRPVALGHLYNITPVALGAIDLGDGALLTYQSHWRGVVAHDAVRIRGVAQLPVTATPGVGEFRDWPGLGVFQLGSTPDGPVTTDLRGDNPGGYVSSLAAVLRRLVQSLGPAYADDDIQADAFAFAETDLPGEIGWFHGPQQTTAAAAVEEMLAAAGAVLCGGRGGTLRLFDPLADAEPQFTLGYQHIIDLAPVALPAGLRPLPRAIAVTWRRNWAPTDNLAGIVGDADRAQLQAAASGPARAISASVTARVAQQRELAFPGLYWNEADALARAGKWRDWIEAGPRLFQVTTDRFLGQIECGDVCRLFYPAYGLAAGARCTVIGWAEQLGARRLTLTLATLPEV
ncbi:MAG: hypothetical protein BGP12_09735 [Rhodospirillales bacterium 70-18]|nr:MAG: hypothetical protein BGP12_09735 [Rhodospirillales bacterium 70-18]